MYASVAEQFRELGRIAVRNTLCADGRKVEKMVAEENMAGFEG